MLQLTENATTIVRSIAEQSQGAGLRLASNTEPDGAMSAALVPNAEADDQIVEQEGARVFLDQAAAAELDDKVLDAGMDASGNVQFGISQQA
ncbi:Fe-S cluster assembly iron-binding protein IscA [Nocardioides luteus]|uniref:Iron-sulfur cluster biosynthesis protein n=1 Tax=Nocardioides luteus TaxID=1844 RepID=A0ABQ5T188_9ACTN|nr:Fe-S cluster assembly protein HesB [Nocardioides luteus]MDR7310525.1 Fe-S cluster assembly iron-binding protein IscA [Nocardioides luteus]GGR42243.1 iron-sulfur cluster biosynthesis protein [Nocardioides luteus]GLJ69693.1 iron-sulfur cluster biosynthesis protein [Nocardioides luteus]